MVSGHVTHCKMSEQAISSHCVVSTQQSLHLLLLLFQQDTRAIGSSDNTGIALDIKVLKISQHSITAHLERYKKDMRNLCKYWNPTCHCLEESFSHPERFYTSVV